ncbi:hypothetical protein TNCV_4499671 [Trichonephila clavipes]|nr:hypothetical protein TNCV_4499671 [Trichonephila clavipes]
MKGFKVQQTATDKGDKSKDTNTGHVLISPTMLYAGSTKFSPKEECSMRVKPRLNGIDQCDSPVSAALYSPEYYQLARSGTFKRKLKGSSASYREILKELHDRKKQLIVLTSGNVWEDGEITIEEEFQPTLRGVENIILKPVDDVRDQQEIVLLSEEVGDKGFLESISPTFRDRLLKGTCTRTV